MDEPGGHYAKRNKSDREKQILDDLTYTWNVKMSNSYREYIGCCKGLEVGRNEGMKSKSMHILLKDKYVQGI